MINRAPNHLYLLANDVHSVGRNCDNYIFYNHLFVSSLFVSLSLCLLLSNPLGR
ncbi:hypothetical protein BDW75DRAFT_200872 [Aspergillus navahoensis]